MEITFLGTKSVSVYEANSLGILIRAKDTSLLLECGPFIPLQLTQNNFKIESIDSIFVSHDHSDHGGGLPYFLFTNLMYRFLGLVPGSANLKLIMPNYENSYLFKYCKKTYPLIFTTNDFLTVQVIGSESTSEINLSKTFSVKTFAVNHTIENWGISCTVEGKKISYLPDTEFNESFCGPILNSEILICSVLGPKNRKDMSTKLKFMTANDAAKLAHLSNSKKLILLHIFYEEDVERCIEEARVEFNGDIIIPLSGRKIFL